MAVTSAFDLIQSHVKSHPDSVAVSKGDRALTYHELDNASQDVAALLTSKGVGQGDYVPLLASRGLELAICVLAIMRISAVLIPMEIGTWGQDRIDAVSSVVDYKAALVTDDDARGLRNAICCKSLTPFRRGSIAEDGRQRGPASSQDIAYMIFTSGTTGAPKGVMIRHESLLNYVWPPHTEPEIPFNLGITATDTTLLMFSVAFDAFYGVLFSAWCNGSHVLLSEPSTFIEDAKLCTILPATPTLLSTLAEPQEYKNIRGIFLGGEAPSPALVEKWWKPYRRMYNAYGPTEATVSVTMAELVPGRCVTLGEPIRNSTIVLLDSDLNESSEGEICVCGPKVLAAGYYRDPEQTRQRFIEWKGQRTYRTGDMAKRTANGLVFLGRKDKLVKNRGFLVNIDTEVVPALLSYPGVISAAAIMYKQKMVGFISPKVLDGSALRQALSLSLGQFLVPDEIIAMDQLPLTTNGKLDSKALLVSLMRREIVLDYKDLGGEGVGNFKSAVAESLQIPPDAVAFDKSFVQHGGNSMAAIKLIGLLRNRGLSLTFPALFSLSSLGEVFQNDVQSISAIRDAKKVDHSTLEAKELRRLDALIMAEGRFLLTSTQLGLIRSTTFRPPTGYMLISMTPRPGQNEISPSKLCQAWKHVLSGVSIFRSRFNLSEGYGEIQQHYEHNWKLIPVADGELVAGTVREQSRVLEEQAKLGFAASEGDFVKPVNAFSLVLPSQGSPVLLWLVHHALIDSWSANRIMEQVQSLLTDEHHSQASNPLFDFPDYSQAVPRHLQEVRGAAHDFWTHALAGHMSGTELKVSYPQGDPVIRTQGTHECECATQMEVLPMGLFAEDFQASSNLHGEVSSAVVFYAAWALLLQRYSGDDKVVFGSAISARSFPMTGIQDTIGPLLNHCPVPITIDLAMKRLQFLSQVQDLLLQIVQYQWSSSEVLGKIASGSHARLFSTALFLEHEHVSLPWSCQRTDWPEFDLAVQVQNVDGQLSLRAVFNSEVYLPRTIQRLLGHFRNLSLALLHPNELVADVQKMMLDNAEMSRLIWDNVPSSKPDTESTVLQDAFQVGVKRWPSSVAIETPSEKLSYRNLDAITNVIAAAILRAVEEPHPVIAVLGDGSKDWIIAALSVVRSGGTYLPLDTKLPPDRMAKMMEISGASLCIYANQDSVDKFSSLPGPRLVLSELPCGVDTAAQSRAAPSSSDDYAYIMFTSGSTGTPKGIRVTHRATMSHFAFKPALMNGHPGRRHAQVFSAGFDVSIAEVFGTLCTGATLVLKDPADPYAHLRTVHATMMTPSLLSVLSPTDHASLDTIYLIGEAVPQGLSDRWSMGRTLYNFYGPCECTIAALYTRLQPKEMVTIGKPIPGVGVYLLDQHGMPVPLGVSGEICLSGVQVAGGYIGQGSVSRKAFVDDPFVPGERMYRTGDLGVWTEPMQMRFLGRADHQVKVRGYRVELEEIEHVIRQSSTAVFQAAVLVVQDRIFAFVTPECTQVAGIEAALRRQLPAYAVPQRIFTLDVLPITPNQKLDRKTLIQKVTDELVTSSPGKQTMEADSASQTEVLIKKAWREAIGIDDDIPIGSADDFMVIGGHSLLQITVAKEVCSQLSRSIPLGVFIVNTQLSALASAVDQFCAGDVPASFLDYWGSQDDSLDDTQLSPQELELFKMDVGSSLNVAHVVDLEGDVHADLITKALEHVLLQHRILRTNYRVKNGVPQRVISDYTFHVDGPFTNLDAVTLNNIVNKPFDLAKDQLIRVAVVQEKQGKTTLVLVLHHIVTDQTSVQNLLRLVSHSYSAIVKGETPVIQNTADYQTWAVWKRKQMINGPSEEDRRYWESHFAGVTEASHIWACTEQALVIPAHSPPVIVKRPQVQMKGIETCLALVTTAWQRCVDDTCQDLLLGIPFVDRSEPGTDDMLGVFLDTLPVRLSLNNKGTSDWESLVATLQSLVRSTITHAIPHSQIREIVGKERLFDIMVVYNRRQERISRAVDIAGVTARTEAIRARGAKFPLLIEFTEEDGEGLTLELEYFESAITSTKAYDLLKELYRLLSSGT